MINKTFNKIMKKRSKQLFESSAKTLFNDGDENLIRLEKDLIRENKREKVEQSEPQLIIPGFERQPIEDKLWKYFVSRVQSTLTKVQKEQVNIWTRQMNLISNEVIKRIEGSKSRLLSMQSLIQSKHRLIHQIFQIMRQQEIREKQGESIPFAHEQKAAKLKQQISHLKAELEDLNKQQYNMQQQKDKIIREYVSFLRKLLIGEYYRDDGIVWIVRQLLIFSHKVSLDNFPTILSQAAKEYILRIAAVGTDHNQKIFQSSNKQYIQKDMTRNVKDKTIKNTKTYEKRLQIGEKTNIGRTFSLLQPSQLKKIYHLTQDHMSELIRQPQWRQTLILPRLCPPLQNAEQKSIIDLEKCKELLMGYLDPKARKRARALLIGPKTTLVF